MIHTLRWRLPTSHKLIFIIIIELFTYNCVHNIIKYTFIYSIYSMYTVYTSIIIQIKKEKKIYISIIESTVRKYIYVSVLNFVLKMVNLGREG